MDGITGPGNDLKNRRLVSHYSGRLPFCQANFSSLVRSDDLSLEDGEKGFIRLHIHVEFCSFDRCIHKRRHHPDASALAAEEVDSSPQEADQGGLLCFGCGEGNRGVLVEAEGCLIKEDNICPASCQDPDPVTGTVSVVKLHGEPLLFVCSKSLYASLSRDDFGHPLFARAPARQTAGKEMARKQMSKVKRQFCRAFMVPPHVETRIGR